MNVQFIGPATPRIHAADADVIVSYGYRHLIPATMLEATRAINLHIGYLPFNRGAHPNFWAAHDGTPAGVTIHFMDEGLDTGPILCRQRVDFEPGDTLRSSYERLQQAVWGLFLANWPEMLHREPMPQPEGGSYHRAAELPDLPLGWDTPVEEVASWRSPV